jgi:predicted regulator of Ras-like GTPase activity (Roadblock/LC7/MglB family)
MAKRIAAIAQTTTTVSQEARARGTAGILAEMADGETSEEISGDAAAAALAYLTEMSPDLRGAAILGREGSVLAASGHPDRWREDAAALFEVADRAGGEPVEQLHIGTAQGEVFAIRHAGLAAVAVTERFALASLTLFDMRSLLRDLGAGGDGAPDGP